MRQGHRVIVKVVEPCLCVFMHGGRVLALMRVTFVKMMSSVIVETGSEKALAILVCWMNDDFV